MTDSTLTVSLILIRKRHKMLELFIRGSHTHQNRINIRSMCELLDRANAALAFGQNIEQSCFDSDASKRKLQWLPSQLVYV